MPDLVDEWIKRQSKPWWGGFEEIITSSQTALEKTKKEAANLGEYILKFPEVEEKMGEKWWRETLSPIHSKIVREEPLTQEETREWEAWLRYEPKGIRPIFVPAEKWAKTPPAAQTAYRWGTAIAILAGLGYAGLPYLKAAYGRFTQFVPRYQPIIKEVRGKEIVTTGKGLKMPVIEKTVIGYRPVTTPKTADLTRQAEAFRKSIPAIIREMEPTTLRYSTYYKELYSNLLSVSQRTHPYIAEQLARQQAKIGTQTAANLVKQGADTWAVTEGVMKQLAEVTPAIVDKLIQRKRPEEVTVLRGEVAIKPRNYQTEIEEIDKQLKVEPRPEFIKSKQNLEISRNVAETGYFPDKFQQQLYVYNLTGEHMEDPTRLDKEFTDYLKENDPTAYQALIKREPVIHPDSARVELEAIRKERQGISKSLNTRFEDLIDFVKDTLGTAEKTLIQNIQKQGGIKHTPVVRDYGTKKDEGWQIWPLAAKNKNGLPFDEMAESLGMTMDELNTKLEYYAKKPTRGDYLSEAMNLVYDHPDDYPELFEIMIADEGLEERQFNLQQALTNAEKSDTIKISEETAFRTSEQKITATDNWEEWEGIQSLVEVEEALPARFPLGIEGTPPAIGPPPSIEELLKEEEPDYRVGIRAQLDSSEHWSMDYEEKTGVPVYSEVIRPTIEAGKSRFRDNKYYDRFISGIFKGVSRNDIVQTTLYMKGKQAKEEVPELSPELMKKTDEIRAMFDYGFQRFGIAPERYLQDYLPLLSGAERKRLEDIPISWEGIPSEVIPFFKRARKSMGEIIDAFTVEDLLRLYFNAGTWAEYRNTIHELGDVSKDFPIPAKNEVNKLAAFLTGGIGDFDKAFKTSISQMIGKMTKGDIEEDTDVMSALVNTVYLGTIAGNPGSAVKNLTQSFHNWSEMPAKWMAIGNKLYFSEEGQKILTQSGIQTGFAPYVQRNIERYYGKSTWRKLLKGQAHLRNVGMFLFQSADHYNRGTIYLAEWARMNHFISLLAKEEIDKDTFYSKTDFAGLHPTIQKMGRALVEQEKWEQLADMVADQRQAMTQWRYQREVRPQWMRSGVGKIGGQFLTWPTYGLVMHGGRYKRAAEAFKRGQRKEGAYQIWKEIKWMGMVAATVYTAKKAGVRLWPWFVFLPTQAAAAVQPVISAYQATVLKIEGYDWLAARKWSDAKWSAKIFVPFGVEIGNIMRGLEEEQPARVIGIPTYPREGIRREELERPTYEVDIVDEWLKKQK